MVRMTGSEDAIRQTGCERHLPQACDGALSSAFQFLGKRWTGLVLGTLINGPAGFADLRRAIHGISDSMLSERLLELTDAGLVTRSVAQGPPIAVRYALTPAGQALLPAMKELGAWAAANLGNEEGASSGSVASTKPGGGGGVRSPQKEPGPRRPAARR
jgi:DNA-binding HxlR family transcriptional regulator